MMQGYFEVAALLGSVIVFCVLGAVFQWRPRNYLDGDATDIARARIRRSRLKQERLHAEAYELQQQVMETRQQISSEIVRQASMSSRIESSIYDSSYSRSKSEMSVGGPRTSRRRFPMTALAAPLPDQPEAACFARFQEQKFLRTQRRQVHKKRSSKDHSFRTNSVSMNVDDGLSYGIDIDFGTDEGIEGELGSLAIEDALYPLDDLGVPQEAASSRRSRSWRSREHFMSLPTQTQDISIEQDDGFGVGMLDSDRREQREGDREKPRTKTGRSRWWRRMRMKRRAKPHGHRVEAEPQPNLDVPLSEHEWNNVKRLARETGEGSSEHLMNEERHHDLDLEIASPEASPKSSKPSIPRLNFAMVRRDIIL